MKILIAEDEKNAATALAQFLEHRGHQTVAVENGRMALDRALSERFDLVFADVRMPEMDGLELTRRLAAERPELLVVVATAHASVDDAVAALKLGAFDYLTKPLDLDELAGFVSRTAELVDLRKEVEILRQQVKAPGRLRGLVGRDPAMAEAFAAINRAARSDRPALITGETGTGKTVAARVIHETGSRAKAPFVPVNCAAIPTELFESEIFGHLRGAFTGAVRDRKGKIRAAHRGTLLLDEIACLTAPLQAKLLQVLEEGQVVPVGADQGVPVDVRLLVATNEALEARVEEKSFRQDLYYRINVCRIHLPPLRERRADIPLLVHHLLAKLSPTERIDISPEAMKQLFRHRWPGNVRELQNVLEAMIARRSGQELRGRDVPSSLHRSDDPDDGWQHETLDQLMQGFERFCVGEALRRADESSARAADLLGISQRTLERKLAKHALRRRDRTDRD